jgi:putative peptide zinc metalloprotease protein
LACKHFGGECNEMGVMLLIFTPCLYCDVTDSWMVDGKWKRAMIAASGILFELVAASVCMWIWWLTNPGLIHSLCFQVVLVGSVGTVLFNGNPLLKYDGYFVVADLLDRPNLSLQARRVLWNGFSRLYLRRAPNLPADYSGRSNVFLWVYGVLANTYRFILSFVILFVVFKFFQILRLESVGALLVGSVLVGWLGWISKGVGTWIRVQGGFRNVRSGRVSFTLLLVIVLLSAVVWLPLPSRLHSHAFIEAYGARTVTVLVDGKLKSCKKEGATVLAGEEIANFVSEDLELTLVARKGELARQRARLTGLESRRGTDPMVASMMPSVQEAIRGLEGEVQRLESDKDQLTLRAPIDGVVLAPSTIKPSIKPDEIQSWSGLPMDAENIGCVLHRGTTFCEVGDPQNVQGTLYLSQAQIELVKPGHVIFLKSKALPSITFRGIISEVGSTANMELPSEVASAGIFPSQINRNGKYESTEPIFLAKVEFAPQSHREYELMPLHHSIAKASIQIDSQSIGERIARFVFATFAIDPTVKRKLSP